VTVFDPDREWTFSAIEASSAASNSPFDGWKMTGRAEYTVVGGKVVWDCEQEGAG
jgi:dihydroorotase